MMIGPMKKKVITSSVVTAVILIVIFVIVLGELENINMSDKSIKVVKLYDSF